MCVFVTLAPWNVICMYPVKNGVEMKYAVVIALSLCAVAFGQYYSERVTEQSFDKSSIYYKPSFLNRFSFSEFGTAISAATGDKYYQLYLNPAFLAADTGGFAIAVDFLGDRSNEGVQDGFVMPAYYASSYRSTPIDYRWFTVSRPEPTPLLAVGITSPQARLLGTTLRFAAAYQAIYRQEKFYTVPYWIYYPSPFYDALGVRYQNTQSMPVTVKSAGKDEMVTEGHLLNFYLAFVLSENISFGAGYGYVTHNRSGSYLNAEDNAPQGSTSVSRFTEETARKNDYYHHDVSAGVQWKDSSVIFGVKVGILAANAAQQYSQHNFNLYTYGTINQGNNWSHYYSDSRTAQYWMQDGTVPYAAVSLRVPIQEGNIFGSYEYRRASVNSASNGTIADTAFNSSRWEGSGNSWYLWSGYSYLLDSRTGTTDIRSNDHNVMLGAKWQVTSGTTLSLGLLYNLQKYSAAAQDPATARLGNNYTSSSATTAVSSEYFSQLEKKTVAWQYNATQWELTMPLLLTFDVGSRWQWTVGLLRSLSGWSITDETTAYFDYRNTNRNGLAENKALFGERYIEPAKRITEENFDIITGATVKISPKLQAKVFLNPETTKTFDLLWQWWLGIEASL